MARKHLCWAAAVAAILAGFAVYFTSSEKIREYLVLEFADGWKGNILAGKKAFADHQCNNCHTVLGSGSSFAPDLSTAYVRLGRETIRMRIHETGSNSATQGHANESEDAPKIEAYLHFASSAGAGDDRARSPRSWWEMTMRQIPAQMPLAPGAALLQQESCMDCHLVAGMGGNKGPRLDMVGAKREARWIADYLANPQKFRPDTEMPDFKQLTPEQRDAVAGFVAALSRGHRR